MDAPSSSMHPHTEYTSAILVENGINVAEQPYAAMLEALGEYEHGSVDLIDVGGHPTLEQYAYILIDLAMIIENTRQPDMVDAALGVLTSVYRVYPESRNPVVSAIKCILSAHGAAK